MTSVIELRDVRVAYGGAPVLDVPRLEVEPGEILAVVGPNGAGKSTLLRVIGLLEPPASGEVRFRGEPVARGRRLAVRRQMASVFQSPLLVDATVFDNVALGLRFRHAPPRETAKRVGAWLERFGIADLARRPARTLSGGEAQRVALARALVLGPALLLLDEPFSALDQPTREALIDELAGILREERVSTVFVTHDRDEALRLGDRVAVMMGGRILQMAPPGEVFATPVSEEVARFVGVENILAGEVVGAEEGLVQVRVGGRELVVAGAAAPGERVLVCLRPEDIVLSPVPGPAATSARNALVGKVLRLVPVGFLLRVVVDCGVPLAALVTRPSAEALGLEEGREVIAGFKATAAHLLRLRGWLDNPM